LRYPKSQKASTRQRLLERSARHAKQHGFAGSGMDALAGSAGVTTGSLYRHFAGKSDLFAAVVGHELARTAAAYAALPADDPGAVVDALTGYLSVAHVDHPERGCLLPSLTAEVARADDAVRSVFEAGVGELHALLVRHAGSAERAWALLAQIVGAVLLARAVRDEPLRQQVLESARHAALSLLKPT
jgi:AcrR family transcriptional regulator